MDQVNTPAPVAPTYANSKGLSNTQQWVETGSVAAAVLMMGVGVYKMSKAIRRNADAETAVLILNHLEGKETGGVPAPSQDPLSFTEPQDNSLDARLAALQASVGLN